MVETPPDSEQASGSNTVSEILHIPETSTGNAIGVLVLCGQGPNQARDTDIKIGDQDKMMPGSVKDHEANTWMRIIARAAGELDKTGQVGLIIPSGGNSRSGSYEKDRRIIAPTEAELMQDSIEKVYGTYAPQSDQKYSRAAMDADHNAHNTIDNVLNGLQKIHDRKQELRDKNLPEDPNLYNVWFLVSHFHLPRIQILASLFGFDPSHVISAEQVVYNASIIKEQQVADRGELDPEGFNKQEALQTLILARLGSPLLDTHGDYIERKQMRAEKNLSQVIDMFVNQQDISEIEKHAEKEWIQRNLTVEEGKSAHMRMRDERRWVRGLAMEADYVLPYAQMLTDNEQVLRFLLKFNAEQLKGYDIDREQLERVTAETLASVVEPLRARMKAEDWKKNRWHWEVVKSEWQNEEYPTDVKMRFRELGVDDSLVQALSSAQVPQLVL